MSFEEMLAPSLNTGGDRCLDVYVRQGELADKEAPATYELDFVTPAGIFSVPMLPATEIERLGQWLTAIGIERKHAEEDETLDTIVVGAYTFTRFVYGFRCPALKCEVHRQKHAHGFFWKAFRGNDDVIAPDRAARMATPHYFATPQEAAQACVTIWGKK